MIVALRQGFEYLVASKNVHAVAMISDALDGDYVRLPQLHLAQHGCDLRPEIRHHRSIGYRTITMSAE